mgnify:CR=1 FL=1
MTWPSAVSASHSSRSQAPASVDPLDITVTPNGDVAVDPASPPGGVGRLHSLRWSLNAHSFGEAAATNADVVIYVGGISPQLEGEEMKVNFDGFAGGDAALPETDRLLLRRLVTEQGEIHGLTVKFVDMLKKLAGDQQQE